MDVLLVYNFFVHVMFQLYVEATLLLMSTLSAFQVRFIPDPTGIKFIVYGLSEHHLQMT